MNEETSLAHAQRGGHTCGREDSMRAFAVAILREQDAEEVFVTPEETYVQLADRVVRYRNGAKMRAALDAYLLTGAIPTGVDYTLEVPS